MVLDVTVTDDAVRVGERFAVSFQRTLRVPDDGRDYPLPPGLGPLPVVDAGPYRDRLSCDVPQPAVVVPLYRREALWLAFSAAAWKPNAVQVGVGNVNALTGRPLDGALHDDPQDYVVCPGQPWLDGIAAGDGRVRQFVAVPLGSGYTVEAQLTGAEQSGGIQVVVFEPRRGLFPDEPPPPRPAPPGMPLAAAGGEMGLAAGGSVRQRVHPDPHGLSTWDPANAGGVWVVLLDSVRYQDVTGRPPPPTPVDARTYTEHGLPWFELYDEGAGALEHSELLSGVRSVRELARERGDAELVDDETFDVHPGQIRPLEEPGDERR